MVESLPMQRIAINEKVKKTTEKELYHSTVHKSRNTREKKFMKRAIEDLIGKDKFDERFLVKCL